MTSRTGILLAVFAALASLVGCGGATTTTIIEKPAIQIPPDLVPPGDFSLSEVCDVVSGGYEGQPLYLWARDISCEEAKRLVEQERMPDEWSCGASAFFCTNTDTGAVLALDLGVPAGKQNCPDGMTPAGDDGCAPARWEECTQGTAQHLTRSTPGYIYLQTKMISCAEGAQIARRWVKDWDGSCAVTCVRFYKEFECRFNSDAVDKVRCSRSDPEALVRFGLIFFDV